jgi:LTXXQ motif family protein
MRKIVVSVGAVSAMMCLAIAPALAQPNKPHGGAAPAHPAAPHPAVPRVASPAPHFAPRAAAPHVAAPRAAPHFAATPHVTARPAPHFAPHRATSQLAAHPATPHAGVSHFSARPAARTSGAGAHPSNLAVTNARGALAHNVGPTDPPNFAARRRFADNAALRPFIGRGYHHGFGQGFGGGYGPGNWGWVGPMFWPYAYGDFFFYALWPYEYGYYDPFWAYGYDDIYAGIFSPYDYEPYVQGPQAPARMTALTQGMKNSCASEAAEVTNWPIGQIQQVIQPNDQQKTLLDDLGNAVVKASNDITSHCPSSVAFTPVDRVGQMEVRLQGLVDAVNIISPPLTKFYDSLNDEQKARFNDMGTAQASTAANGTPGAQAAAAANPQQACSSGKVAAWPTEKIDEVVQPTDAQKQKLQALQSAAAQAADILKAACPSEMPGTPPSRLEAVGDRLQAQLKAVQTVEAPLNEFYGSLNDDQKARFNNIGQQIFAQK